MEVDEDDGTRQIFRSLLKYIKKGNFNKISSTREYFIEHLDERSPRYYITDFWNIRKRVLGNDVLTRECLRNAIQRMTEKDVQVIAKLFEKYNASLVYYFRDKSLLELKYDILKSMLETRSLSSYCFIIQKWFFIMPLLEELGNFLTWDKVIELRAYLLDSDSLYKLLVAILYEN
ncbi:uncharacterized protein LOC126264500 [Aethina tumida]|uniref:uncharacterized protein LOC126264500 n=1 Tax=Aethina tumida TaxID=116153 RepID=UPI002148AE85|nr:uncharacterized protein LOC126264500 [Aethina tumida]